MTDAKKELPEPVERDGAELNVEEGSQPAYAEPSTGPAGAAQVSDSGKGDVKSAHGAAAPTAGEGSSSSRAIAIADAAPPPPFTAVPIPGGEQTRGPVLPLHQPVVLIVGGVPSLPPARSSPGRRAARRFLEAAMYAFLFYLLIMIMVSGSLESAWDDAARRRHHGHRWDDDDRRWTPLWTAAGTSAANVTVKRAFS